MIKDYNIILGGSQRQISFYGPLSFCVVRLKPNGVLDSSFKPPSPVINSRDQTLGSIVVQPDGKIIGAGSINYSPALVRYNSNGTLDTAFGDKGYSIKSRKGYGFFLSVALQNDNKIVCGGTFYFSDFNSAAVIARYKNDDVLPLSFINIKAIPFNNVSIVLNWQTAQENNNDYFAVERSEDSRFRGNDGGEFELTRINSKGNSSQSQSFSYTDNTPLHGTNFYRLKQVDKDGKFSYSQIVSATIQNGLSVVLYPNPVRDV